MKNKKRLLALVFVFAYISIFQVSISALGIQSLNRGWEANIDLVGYLKPLSGYSYIRTTSALLTTTDADFNTNFINGYNQARINWDNKVTGISMQDVSQNVQIYMYGGTFSSIVSLSYFKNYVELQQGLTIWSPDIYTQFIGG